ncbi:hypothetical protein [Paenibacillus sp. MBLB4367]|uniref:hypothetical protein n=1 Tax=Paenibacillus sp. MBLB4367 TaxID=3384767 RepID=UPI003907E8D0
MNLIDLLLKNAHIVIFVAIGLFTMWAKARRKAQPSGRGMPSFGGPANERPSQKREPSASMGRKPPSEASSRDVSAKPAAAVSAGRPGKADVSRQNDQEAQQPRDDVRLTLDNAVQGVIWAEVLGAPRAKRPYRPR